MQNLNERLLSAWLNMSSVVNNERIVASIPFNEAHVCNLLYRQRMTDPENYLTATELCAQTRMLKSQMNKVLSSLEKRGMIERFQAADDRRKAYIRLAEDHIEEYEDIHAQTIDLVDRAIEKLGPENAENAATLLWRIAESVDEALKERGC